eukprot:455095-Hanusia_phi.AAC.1
MAVPTRLRRYERYESWERELGNESWGTRAGNESWGTRAGERELGNESWGTRAVLVSPGRHGSLERHACPWLRQP